MNTFKNILRPKTGITGLRKTQNMFLRHKTEITGLIQKNIKKIFLRHKIEITGLKQKRSAYF